MPERSWAATAMAMRWSRPASLEWRETKAEHKAKPDRRGLARLRFTESLVGAAPLKQSQGILLEIALVSA